MHYGVVILPDERWRVAQARWRAAEALGFDHAWTYDHLTWRSLRDSPWFGALPTLAAAAAVTSRIRLGTLVASPNFRHPVPLAKELMTLDDITEGRLTLGIGAGGTGFDALALGGPELSPGERHARFEEFIGFLDQTLRQPGSSFEGRFYAAREARSIPGCVQKPRIPFAVAAEGPRSMRLAAQHGGTWVTVDGRAAAGDQLARFEEACLAVGREPSSVRRLVLLGFVERPLASLAAFLDAAGRYREMGFTDLVVHWPRKSEPFAARASVLEAVAEHLRARPRDTRPPSAAG